MSGDGSDTRSLGEANKRRILNALRERGRATLEDLVRGTGRSAPTVLKWLAELEQEGYLYRSGRARSTGGRRPVLYRFDSTRGYLLGLAIEIPEASITMVDLRGHEVDTSEWNLGIEGEAEPMVEAVLERMRKFVRPHAEEGRDLLGASVVITGFIDRDSGRTLGTPRVASWLDVPLRQMVSNALGVPVTLHHHIDALTLAESVSGSATGLRDFLYFDVGHGLGIRAVRDGDQLRGRFGNAGLIGHTTVVPDGRPCLCGNRGCLEEYVSGRVVLRDHATSNDVAEPSLSRRIELVASRLFLAARHREPAASEAVEEMRRYLAIGVANAVNLFDLPHVILSGFVRAGGDDFRNRLEEDVRARLQPTLARHTRIELAKAPRSRAAGRGAALFALAERFPFTEPLVPSDSAKGEEVSAAAEDAIARAT